MVDENSENVEAPVQQDNSQEVAARIVLFAAMEDIPKELANLLETEANCYGYVFRDLKLASDELMGEHPMGQNILMALHEARKKASHILQRVNDIESIYMGYLQHLMSQQDGGGDK